MDAATAAACAASAAVSLPCSDTPLEVQLFYRYVQLPDPEAVVTQLRCLCEELGPPPPLPPPLSPPSPPPPPLPPLPHLPPGRIQPSPPAGSHQADGATHGSDASSTPLAGLSGRMRIASEGINGILCGTPEQLARYREAMGQPGSPLEGLDVQYKLSAAGAHHRRPPPPLEPLLHYRCRYTIAARHRHPTTATAALSLPLPPP